jgi:hypothetical protein
MENLIMLLTGRVSLDGIWDVQVHGRQQRSIHITLIGTWSWNGGHG